MGKYGTNVSSLAVKVAQLLSCTEQFDLVKVNSLDSDDFEVECLYQEKAVKQIINGASLIGYYDYEIDECALHIANCVLLDAGKNQITHIVNDYRVSRALNAAKGFVLR